MKRIRATIRAGAVQLDAPWRQLAGVQRLTHDSADARSAVIDVLRRRSSATTAKRQSPKTAATHCTRSPAAACAAMTGLKDRAAVARRGLPGDSGRRASSD